MPQDAAAPLPPDAALFEHAPCGLMTCSTDGNILRANATLCLSLGYTQDELVGHKRVQDLLSIGGKVFYQTHCSPLLSIQGSVAEVQLEMLTRDGKRLPVLLNIVRRQHGAALYDEYAVVVTTDRRAYERELLAERKKAEAALEARLGAEAKLREANEQLSLAHRRKDEFLATLAHELRNPLAPMRNVLEVLRMQRGGALANDWALNVLDRQTGQLTHLVDDLMDVSRITQGRLQLRRKPCDLCAIVRAAVDDIDSMVKAAGHTLAVPLPDGQVTVDADETRLAQVIANLLTNAVKYTPQGGHIWLNVTPGEREVAVAVRDTGIGIPREALGSVFEMFSQLVPALERSQGGLGIGLALVRGLVELHQGRIEASSDGPGQGSTFTVTLPLIVAPEASEPAPILPDCQGSCRILVVDDNVDAADTLCMALELFGHQVRTAHTAAAGLEAAAEFKPVLILLDIGLPDMNGYEVARRIRAEPWGEHMMLVAATGWGQDADRARATDAGFDRHLVKPIEFDRLRELLNELTG